MAFFDFLKRLFQRPPKFDFGTGTGSLQRVIDAVNAAFKAGDEAQLRAIWEHVDATVPRDATEILETNKPIYAGRMLGQFLNNKERFAEAEAILLRVKTWRKGTLSELLDTRFALADAIWGQGDRERAEKDALALIANLLKDRAEEWPNSAYFARLAQYRYNFPEYGRTSEMAFQDVSNEKLQPQIEANRRNAQSYLKTALAWHEAGRYTPALAALEKVYACNSSPDHRMMALNLEFFWRNSLGDEERVDAILAEMTATAALAPGKIKIQQRLKRTQVHLAQWNGELDRGEALLQEIGAESYAGDEETTQLARAEIMALRGEWDKARQIYAAKAQLHTVPSRHGARFITTNAMAVAFLELRAHYCGAPAKLPQAHESLTRAAILMRGDAKLSLWIEALQMSIEASLATGGDDARVRLKAGNIAAKFDEWHDSPDTQNTLAPLLMGTYSLVREWKKAAFWGEKALELSHKPVYFVSYAENLANIYEALHEPEKARHMRQDIVNSGLPTVAVKLAREQLEK